MRNAHFEAFKATVQAGVPALASNVYDGDVPLDGGKVRRATYLVLHDMGFDSQDDKRLIATFQDRADGRYRVIVRTVSTTRFGVRETAGISKAAIVGQIPVITGRICGPIDADPGPRPVERDDDVNPPIFYLDTDYTFRSQRA